MVHPVCLHIVLNSIWHAEVVLTDDAKVLVWHFPPVLCVSEPTLHRQTAGIALSDLEGSFVKSLTKSTHLESE